MTIRKRIPAVLVSLAALALLAPATAPAATHYVLNEHFESAFATALAKSNNKTIHVVEAGDLAVDDSCALHSPVLTETTSPTCKEFDPSNGDLYVVDPDNTAGTEHSVIDKFEVTGSGSAVKVEFLCELGGSTLKATATPCAKAGVTKAKEEFTLLKSIAIGPKGEVFIISNKQKRIDEFNAAGEWVQELTGYSADAATGTTAAAFSEPKALAVEPATGDLFVGDETTYEHSGAKTRLIDKLKAPTGPTPELIQQLTSESIPGLTTELAYEGQGLAVDANDLYLFDAGVVKLYRFKPEASPDEELDEFDPSLWAPPHPPGASELPLESEGNTLAVNPATNGIVVGQGSAIDVFGYSPGALEELEKISGSGLKATIGGQAISASGIVYNEESKTVLRAYELAAPPSTGACAVSSITNSGAKLEASVDPEGDETEYQFEYGTSTSYGTKTTKLSAGSGTSAVSESATITGLTPATKYDCRIYATSSGGEAHGANGEFTTKLAIEGVKTLPASSVAFESATINASLRPEGTPTVEYFIEYGTTTAYGHHTTAKTSSSSEVAVSEALSGLTPLTTYHYRIVAKREIEGKTYATDGSDVAFTTGGVPPGVIAESVSGVGAFSATLEATINPGNSATTYWFEYGTSPTSEQAFIPTGTVAGDGNVIAAPETLQNLAPDTTYYYHVVAENQFGRVEGVEGAKGPEERSFTTQPAYAPEVSLSPVGEVAQTTAGVSLSVDPNGLATEYEVQLGQEGSYVPVVVQSAGEGETPVQIGLALSALAPGSTYQVRVLAWNAAGEVTSTTQTFTTGASPAFAFVQPVTPVLVSFTPASIVEPPVTTTTTTSKTKSLTKAQKLAKALKQCRKDVRHAKKEQCEKKARKRYAPAKKKTTKKKH